MRHCNAQTQVTLGKETTFISEPLAEDGLPDYGRALLERQRAGVTPENNAAVLIWTAIGRHELSERQFRFLCHQLGVDAAACFAPYDGPNTEAFRTSVTKWLQAYARDELRRSKYEPVEPSGEESGKEFDSLIASLTYASWQAEDCPPAARWLEKNGARLDLVVEAANRPRFYSPSPDVQDEPSKILMDWTMAECNAVRDAVRGLILRANYRKEDGDLATAWRDVTALWKLGTTLSQVESLIHSLVGIEVRKRAVDATLALLDDPRLTEDMALKVCRDLASFEQRVLVANAFTMGERLVGLDTTLRFLTGRRGGLPEDVRSDLGIMYTFANDPNQVLRIQNEWYDRLVDVARLEDFASRLQAREAVFKELSDSRESLLENRFGNFRNLDTTSHFVGTILSRWLLRANRALFVAADRDETRLLLLRIAAELALHRMQHGRYPASLDELAPRFLEAIPDDPYANQPLIYERLPDGYRLYSVFENGEDDQGDDFSGNIEDGDWLPFRENSGVEYSLSDAVIRLPIPRPAARPLLRIK